MYGLFQDNDVIQSTWVEGLPAQSIRNLESFPQLQGKATFPLQVKRVDVLGYTLDDDVKYLIPMEKEQKKWQKHAMWFLTNLLPRELQVKRKQEIVSCELTKAGEGEYDITNIKSQWRHRLTFR